MVVGLGEMARLASDRKAMLTTGLKHWREGMDVVAGIVDTRRQGATEAQARCHAIMPPRDAQSPGGLRGYLWAMASVVGVSAIGLMLAGLADFHTIALLYLLPVMVVASAFGRGAGLCATVCSVLALDFFFLPPIGWLRIDSYEDGISLLVLAAVAFFVSSLTDRMRTQARLAAESAWQNAAMAEFSSRLMLATNEAELMQAICAELGRIYDARACVLTPAKAGPRLRAAVPADHGLAQTDFDMARSALDQGLPAGRGSDWLFYPVKGSRSVLAVVGLARDEQREPLAVNIVPLLLHLLNQAALAVDRMLLENEMREATQRRERDRVLAALLSSVSHDLRTPLTVILGATAEIRRRNADELVGIIDAEARRLNRFISNLLDMARIESEALRLNFETIDLTDAVAGAIRTLRNTVPGADINLQLPPGLPLLQVDPQLFHQVMVNLLEYASSHAARGASITIAATHAAGTLVVSVLDQGQGLAPGQEHGLFETFARIEGSDRVRGGTGLGLAIVKGFAQAMGLTVTATNRRETCGTCISLHFPEDRLVDPMQLEHEA